MDKHSGIDAVIFDWGGTLTPWLDVDMREESRVLARAVVSPGDPQAHAEALFVAGEGVWAQSRDAQQSASIASVFANAGLEFDPGLLDHYYDFWVPHTWTDPDVVGLFEGLRDRGIKVGVLSNTIWPREWHRGYFERDGVLHLIDGDVYTSEIAWTKPAPEAFRAAMAAVGVADPTRCVYVGDRLYDDVWGAHNAGMRAIHVPHSNIPVAQIGHTQGRPDGTVGALREVLQFVDDWAS